MKIYSVYKTGVITDCQEQNWFSKFLSGDTLLKDKFKQELSNGFDEEMPY